MQGSFPNGERGTGEHVAVGRWVTAIGIAACEAVSETIDSADRAIDALVRVGRALEALRALKPDWRRVAVPSVAAAAAFMGQRGPAEVDAELAEFCAWVRSEVRAGLAGLHHHAVAADAMLRTAAVAILNADAVYVASVRVARLAGGRAAAPVVPEGTNNSPPAANSGRAGTPSEAP